MILSTAPNTAQPLDMVILSDPFLSILVAPFMASMIMIIKVCVPGLFFEAPSIDIAPSRWPKMSANFARSSLLLVLYFYKQVQIWLTLWYFPNNLFCHRNIVGSYTEWTGPLFISNVPELEFGHTCGEDYVACARSFLVDCKQQYPDCQPEDSWKTVASFDNTLSDLPSTFTYK